MRKRVLMLYIKALEKYLGLPSMDSQSKNVQDFLITAWKHAGFREYVKKRNDDLIYEAAGGPGMAMADRIKYIELVGRRIENLYFSAMAKRLFEADDKRKRAKYSENIDK